jgi:hypothetical protein
MKTLKNKLAASLVLLIALVPFVFTACTDENVDLRDDIVGEYDYLVKIYALNNDGTLEYLGNEPGHYDIEGTMRVTKGAGMDMLDFWDGNVRMFYAENLIDKGDAIVFDVLEQEGWIGPVNVQVSGFDEIQNGNSWYHGAFFFDDESIEIGFTARVMDVETGLVMVLTAFRN